MTASFWIGVAPWIVLASGVLFLLVLGFAFGRASARADEDADRQADELSGAVVIDMRLRDDDGMWEWPRSGGHAA